MHNAHPGSEVAHDDGHGKCRTRITPIALINTDRANNGVHPCNPRDPCSAIPA